MKRYFLLYSIFMITTIDLSGFAQVSSDATVYIIPPCGYHNEKLFDMSDVLYNRDDCMRPFYVLREVLRAQGYDLKTTTFETLPKQLKKLIVCDFPFDDRLSLLKQYSKDDIILLILEPPTVVSHYYNKEAHAYFGKIFTMLDDLVDNKKYFKLHYPQPSLTRVQPLDFDKKKLCTLIAGNNKVQHPLELYSERRNWINYCEKNALNLFEFYGRGWDKENLQTYKGSLLAKVPILKTYKFCVCYENTKDTNGYITEKIFDVLISSCVPIYLGAPNITDYVPSNCFIDRRQFESDQHLFDFIKNMTEEKYQEYSENIKLFLKGPRAALFSAEHFANVITKALL
jgi:alpha(1,3/1,4) fucosyltransferase